MTYTKKERERYNEDRQRACNRLGITKNQYNWFRREGEKLRLLQEEDCNGHYSTDNLFSEDWDKVAKPVIAKAFKIGLCLFFQTDPRGATIYLDKEPIPENNYTQAVCIY